MANAKCRICCRAADAGPCCGKCAADIMAKALNHFFGERRRKLHRPQPPKPSAPSSSDRWAGCSGSDPAGGPGRRPPGSRADRGEFPPIGEDSGESVLPGRDLRSLKFTGST